MAALRYITHPQVLVDPRIPVGRWTLSTEGWAAARQLLDEPWVAAIRRIVTSEEVKALDTARLLATHLGIEVEPRAATGEIDRSATGFLPPSEFERVADACFADPTVSASGWECAVDAQGRIVAALADLLIDESPGDIAVVGHGGVGTFWFCHLAGVPIDRRRDQPGQGHYFTVDRSTGRPLHAWRPITGDRSRMPPRRSSAP